MYRLRNTVTGEVAYSYDPYTVTYPHQVILFHFYASEAVHSNQGPYNQVLTGGNTNSDAMLVRYRDMSNPINTSTTMTLEDKIIKHHWEELLSEGNDTTTNYFGSFGATQLNWVLESQNTDLTWSII